MHLFRAPLPELDVRVAPVGRLEGRPAEEAGIQEVSPRQKLSRKKVTPQILNHSHVVNALMAGVPVPMIQKQVGHKRLSTTEIYAMVAPAVVKEAYDLHGFGSVKPISRANTKASLHVIRNQILMRTAKHNDFKSCSRVRMRNKLNY